MTPVRNEAWVLHAFLKVTSLWADYIIIADQQSTDESREIALTFPKVILLDNNNPEFNELERQKILIDRARQIVGDKILFGLDADEMFSANFIQTLDWNNILKSKPGDVYWFRWANVCSNQREFWSPETFYPWMFHDDGNEPHGNYVRNIHSMRIPYPIEEKQMFYVNDFKVLHLAYLNPVRVESKNRFYKFVDWEMNRRSVITLSRTYNKNKLEKKFKKLTSDYNYLKPQYEFNLFDNVEILSDKFWFDEFIYDRIKKYPLINIKRLDIWDRKFLLAFNLTDPRTIWDKIIHFYLNKSNGFSNMLIVRFTDRILKLIGI